MLFPYLNVLIKPASGSCNMACAYCFYADVTQHRAVSNYGIMKTTVAHTLIDRVLSESVQGCTFMFQGGEPTLVGLPFFIDFTDYVRKANVKNIPVHYAIQTNGYSIDDEWAAFLSREKFLTGLSLDGSREINDLFRFDAKGNSVFERIMACAHLFNRHKVEYNILTVVTPQLASQIRKIYPFYKQNGFLFQQYIPCIPDFDVPFSGMAHRPDHFLDAKTYAVFLKKLFDLWWEGMSRGKYVYIRYFENLAALVAGKLPESCGMRGVCGIQFVVEADGSVYPCDFYVTDEWKLGSVLENSFEHLAGSEKARSFIDSSRTLHKDCTACEWYAFCRGGCRRERETTGSRLENRNRFCAAYREFFPYALPRLIEIMKKNGVLPPKP